ncbi:hypothetical protein PGT21_013912 [Puccinia graminis f. sp. tritici]|uniref:Phosphatidylethanolamine-binding protein n=2 Tax=Puccinia graminis f. sp. tritici TaxID=56615 RepID=H6QSH7_PUCGT|nr:uncharacterized protein PGTG_21790 [Puccinia graminis f. sp. tritici CRL 75-36-700-3]EHS63714.1 hypothetical protein PGTG_21790 [Puccinia graminis f. sp. tritici CRL 75-36-700-3]KAA1067749.1 hypothetical protein PGT21_016177 [Puccinia graminis f. sp. tritici]KAA1093506.1 hypothetical protein PGTUg99_023522 [Puccinia graminis f. sp. tritici]KAA1111854.1 hypothetical protein PGT21_013912 [Puccinia graminis f. sp. tritici]
MFLKAVAVLIQLAVLLPPSLISGKPDCPPRKVPDASALKEAMNAFVIGGVVPDLLPQFTPLAIMRLIYQPNPFGTVFFPGQRVPQSLTREQPTIRIRLPPYESSASSALSPDFDYTFIMIDPDVPSRVNSTMGPFRHMLSTEVKLVPNAPYFDLEFPDKLLSPYSPPTPPEASGFHRYTFLLYPGQPSPESIDDFEHKYPSRYHFNLRQFVAEAGLCDPIAGIFMFTENSKDEAKNLVH